MAFTIAISLILPTDGAAEQVVYFGDSVDLALDDFEIFQSTIILDTDETGGDMSLQFGSTVAESLSWDDANQYFVFTDDVNFQGHELIDFRLENEESGPLCDATRSGRQYYNVNDTNVYVCKETDTINNIYAWVNMSIEPSDTATKVVTVGTGGDYADIASAAGYLSLLTGGIILLTPEIHTVDNIVNLNNVTMIGANTDDTIISLEGSGQIDAKETQFKSLTIDIDSGITANFGINAINDTSNTTTSIIFEWVDFIVPGGKSLVDSNESTPPVLRTRFISTSAKITGSADILPSIASANADVSSTHFVESQGGEGNLNFQDWDVIIAGSGNVKTSGKITTIPADTIYVYPGMNLQAAIDSIPGGGTVTILPGVHNVTKPLQVASDSVSLLGYGDASVVRASGFSSTNDQIAALHLGAENGTNPVNDILLKDFKIEVDGPNIHGVRAAGGKDLKVFNLTIQKTSGQGGSGNTARVGIQFIDGISDPLVRAVIKNCRILGNGASNFFTDGIHITGGADYGFSGVWMNGGGIQNALVESNNVDYVRETAAVFVGVNDSSLFNNRFSRMGATGSGIPYGIYMGNAKGINMNQNIISGTISPNSVGIGIDGVGSSLARTFTDSVFSSNTIDGEANGGVGFATAFQIGSTNTQFHRNIFQANVINGASSVTTVGIELEGDADENTFANNTFYGGNTNLWDTAIDIQDSVAQRNTLRGNKMINVATALSDNGSGTVYGVGQHQAGVNPTNSDDNSNGFSLGMLWINTSSNEVFISVDDTNGAAIWKAIDGSSNGGGTISGTDSETFTLDQDGVSPVDNTLQFGASLENIQWNEAQDVFILSDDLQVQGAIYATTTDKKYLWLDIFGGVRQSAGSGAVNRGRTAVIRFDATNASGIRYAFPVPDDWQVGTSITAEVFWSASDNTAGNVDFDFEYSGHAIGDTLDNGNYTDAISGVETVATNTQLEVRKMDVILPGGDINANEMVNFRLRRDPTNIDDTYLADINIHMIRLKYMGKKVR